MSSCRFVCMRIYCEHLQYLPITTQNIDFPKRESKKPENTKQSITGGYIGLQ